MVLLVALKVLGSENLPTQFPARAGGTWNSFQRALKLSESKYEIWARLHAKNGLDSPLSAEILESPNQLYQELISLSSVLRFSHDAFPHISILLVRLLDDVIVNEDLIKAFDISRANKSPQYGLNRFEFHKDSIARPLETDQLIKVEYRERRVNDRGTLYSYVREPRKRAILNDLEGYVGIKVFRSVIPRFRIAMVNEDSPASKSGLEPGDEILKINGQIERDPIEKFTQLSRIRKSEIWIQVKKQNGNTNNLVIKVPGF